MMIEKGDKFLCIKTIRTNSINGEVAYRQGEVYKSEVTGCITDLQGTKCHYWSNIGESPLEKYFVPLEKESLYDEYGKELKLDDEVVVGRNRIALKGKIVELIPDTPQVAVTIQWPNGNCEKNLFFRYGKRNGKICMSEIVKV